MALDKVEKLLPQLKQAEKAQLLRWIVQDLGDSVPGIETTPNVCGGEPCIVRTRIPVWLLVRARQLGSTEADVLNAYPMLRSEDLSNAWAFYRLHRQEIDRQIQENEEEE